MCNCKPKCYNKLSLWESLLKKQEEKVKLLSRKRCEIQHRLDVMQCMVPALMCYKVMQKKPATGSLCVPPTCNIFQSARRIWDCEAIDAEVNVPSQSSIDCSCERTRRSSFEESAIVRMSETQTNDRIGKKLEAIQSGSTDGNYTKNNAEEKERIKVADVTTKPAQVSPKSEPKEIRKTYDIERKESEGDQVHQNGKEDQETILIKTVTTEKFYKGDDVKELLPQRGDVTIDSPTASSDRHQTIKNIVLELIDSILDSDDINKSNNTDDNSTIKSLVLQLINIASGKLDNAFTSPVTEVKFEGLHISLDEKEKFGTTGEKTDGNMNSAEVVSGTKIENPAEAVKSEVEEEPTDDILFERDIKPVERKAKSTAKSTDDDTKLNEIEMAKSAGVARVKLNESNTVAVGRHNLGADTPCKTDLVRCECKPVECEQVFSVEKERKKTQTANKAVSVNFIVPPNSMCLCSYFTDDSNSSVSSSAEVKCSCLDLVSSATDSSIKTESIFSAESSINCTCGDIEGTSLTRPNVCCVCRNAREENANFRRNDWVSCLENVECSVSEVSQVKLMHT